MDLSQRLGLFPHGQSEAELAKWLETHPFSSVQSLFRNEKQAVCLAFRLTPMPTGQVTNQYAGVDLDLHLSIYVLRKRWLSSSSRVKFLLFLNTLQAHKIEYDTLCRNASMQHAMVLTTCVLGCIEETAIMEKLRQITAYGSSVSVENDENTKKVSFWVDRLLACDTTVNTTENIVAATEAYKAPHQRQQLPRNNYGKHADVYPRGLSAIPTASPPPTEFPPPPPPPPPSNFNEATVTATVSDNNENDIISREQLFVDNPFFEAPFGNGFSCMKQQLDQVHEVSYDTPAGMKRLAGMTTLENSRVLERFRKYIDAMDVELVLYVMHENMKPLCVPAINYLRLLYSTLTKMNVPNALEKNDSIPREDKGDDMMVDLPIRLFTHVFDGDVDSYLGASYLPTIINGMRLNNTYEMLNKMSNVDQLSSKTGSFADQEKWHLEEVGEKKQQGDRSLLLIRRRAAMNSATSFYGWQYHEIGLNLPITLNNVKKRLYDHIDSLAHASYREMREDGIDVKEYEKDDVIAVLSRWLDEGVMSDPMTCLRTCVTIRSMKRLLDCM